MNFSRYKKGTGNMVTLFLLLCAAGIDSGAAGPRAESQAGVPAEAGSTDSEKSIIRYIDDHFETAVNLLEKVVNINSGTMNFEGVRSVGRVFQAELDALGFRTRWEEGANFQRAGHLTAEHPGPGPGILLIGHLDTVFEPDSPFQKFERLSPTRARGPGIIDMKGGNVVIIQTLRALQAAGLLESLNIRVVMTGDEESSGRPLGAARESVRAAARESVYALGFEDGDGDPRTAVVARRGSSSWILKVRGKPAHSSQIFREDIGYGAIYEAARILNGFRERLSAEELLTFNPGVILGGTTVQFDEEQSRGSAFGKENVIAELTTVSGDLRCITPEQLVRSREVMAAVAAESLPHTSAEIEFEDSYPPLAPTEGNYRLLALYDEVSRELGFGPVTAVDPRKAGAADISFTSGLVEEALDGLGLMGDDGHTVDETADLTTLGSQAKRAALLIARLSGPNPRTH